MKNDKIPKLQLIYFTLRALAEPPQMMMRFANIKYSYEMAADFYGKPWSEVKNSIPYGQLPMLVVDNEHYIWQSGAIVRYLSKITNTCPGDPILESKVDAVFESTQELFFPLNPTVNVFVGERHKELKETFLKTFPTSLNYFSRMIEKNQVGCFFFGELPFYCDFSAYHHFSLALKLKQDILDDFPLIKRFMKAFEELPSIMPYLEERPELLDIGIAPKMKINNNIVKTASDRIS